MVDRRCCCVGCWSVEDNFDRPNSTDIGDVLVEQWGDSEIRDDQLWMPGGPVSTPRGDRSPTVYTASRHPKRAASGLVYATIKNLAEGNVVRVLINYNPETEEGHHLQVEQTDTEVTISLDTGSSATWAQAPGGSIALVVCYTGKENGLLVCYSPISYVWDQADPVTGGWYAGLVNASVSDVLWDDFKFEEHYVTNTECPYCGCSCNFYIPAHGDITGTFTATGCYSMLDGKSFTLSLEKGSEVAGEPHQLWWGGCFKSEECVWGGMPGLPSCTVFRLTCQLPTPLTPYDITNAWVMSMGQVAFPTSDPCQDEECSGAQLEPQWGWGHCYEGFGGEGQKCAKANEESTCDPFSLVFGPFYGPNPYTDACCGNEIAEEREGSFWVTFTE